MCMNFHIYSVEITEAARLYSNFRIEVHQYGWSSVY